MQKFEFLRQPLLGELAMSRKKKERKREEKKMPSIVAIYVSACSQGQRTHSARTNSFGGNMDSKAKHAARGKGAAAMIDQQFLL